MTVRADETRAREKAWMAAYVALHEQVGQSMGRIAKTSLAQIVADAAIDGYFEHFAFIATDDPRPLPTPPEER